MKSIPYYHLLKWKIIKSRLLFLLPISIFVIIFSHFQIKDAQKHLTPASVSVSGYTRSDGTHVSSYNRRPKGAVKHDAPYEARIMIYKIFYFVGLIVGCIGIFRLFIFDSRTISEIFKKKTIHKINFIVELPKKPYHLINTNISLNGFYKNYNCHFCRKLINSDEFHFSDRKTRKPTKVCLKCASPRIDNLMKNEFNNYIELFNKQKEIFIEQFQKMYLHLAGFLNFDREEIENIFIHLVKEMRKNENK